MKKIVLVLNVVVFLVLGSCTSSYLLKLTSPDFLWIGSNASTGYTYTVAFTTDQDCQVRVDAPGVKSYIGTGIYNYDRSTGNGVLSVHAIDIDGAPARKFYVKLLSNNPLQMTIDEGGDESVTRLDKTPKK